MKFTVEIEAENAAFHGDQCDDSGRCTTHGGVCEEVCAEEIRTLLTAVCSHMERKGGTGGGRIRINDTNGNVVGSAGWKRER